MWNWGLMAEGNWDLIKENLFPLDKEHRLTKPRLREKQKEKSQKNPRNPCNPHPTSQRPCYRDEKSKKATWCLPFVRIKWLGWPLNNGKCFSKISKPIEHDGVYHL